MTRHVNSWLGDRILNYPLTYLYRSRFITASEEISQRVYFLPQQQNP